MTKTAKVALAIFSGLVYLGCWVVGFYSFGWAGLILCAALSVTIGVGYCMLYVKPDDEIEYGDFGRFKTANRSYLKIDQIRDEHLKMNYEVATVKDRDPEKDRPVYTVSFSRVDDYGDIAAIYKQYRARDLDEAKSLHAKLYNDFMAKEKATNLTPVDSRN